MFCLTRPWKASLAILFTLSTAGLATGQQPSSVLETSRQRAAENPRDVSALLNWANAAIAAGKSTEALQAAASARAVAPNEPSILPTLGRAQILAGRLSEALETIESMPADLRSSSGFQRIGRAIEIYQGIGPQIEAADRSGQPDDYQSVATQLAEAAALSPDIEELNKTLGFVYLDKMHQPQRALPFLERAVRLDASDVDGRSLLARTLLELGQFQRSATLYKDLLSNQTEQNVDHQLNLADALIGLNSRDEAQRLLSRILRAQPDNARAQKLLAKAREAAESSAAGDGGQSDSGLPGDSDIVSPEAKALVTEANRLVGEGDRTHNFAYYHAAVARLESALQLEPNSHTINETLGYVLLEKAGQPERAYQKLCRALQLRPGKLATEKLLALAALRSGRVCEAIQRLHAVLRRDPSDLWMLVNLGRAYAQAGEYDCAMSIYEAVLARDRCNFTARLGIAEIQAWRGLSDQPIAAVQRLTYEQPRNTEALSLLGDLYRWDWDLNLAAVQYGRAMAADPARRAGRTGLYEIDKTQSYVASTDGYQFEDNFGFRRSFYGGSLRMPLTERAYLIPRAVLWDYRQGAIELQRTDAIVDLEYHFNRHWDATARFLNFDYSGRDAQQAGSLALKYSPLTAIDLYTSASWGEPAVLTDINIPLFNIRMDSYSAGYDIDLTDRLSTQGSYSHGEYYDGNQRRFSSTQLSFRPDLCYQWFLRVRHEDLNFAQQTPLYFSPNNFELLRLLTEYTMPLTNRLSINAEAEAISVLGESWGWGYRVGPIWKKNDRVELRANYFTTTIPGAAPFSGDGFTYSGSLRF